MPRNRKRPPTESPADTPNELVPLGESVQEVVEHVAEQQAEAARGDPKVRLPDPFYFQTICLSADKNGPRMRLGRSNRYQQVIMQFDEKPNQDTTDALKHDGWRWRSEERVWTKQLDKDARWRTQADAQRLFQLLGDKLRAEKGLETQPEIGA